jgi:GNAT superfamily N-acetyltransferase
VSLLIAPLADHQHLVPTVAGWLFSEWGMYEPGHTVAEAEARLRRRLSRDQLPIVLVALRGEACVGTATLRANDLSTRPDLTPWLASVFVPPAERGHGIGSALVTAVEERARTLGFDRLYLRTFDRQSLYARLGWSVVGHFREHGREEVIMTTVASHR